MKDIKILSHGAILGKLKCYQINKLDTRNPFFGGISHFIRSMLFASPFCIYISLILFMS